MVEKWSGQNRINRTSSTGPVQPTGSRLFRSFSVDAASIPHRTSYKIVVIEGDTLRTTRQWCLLFELSLVLIMTVAMSNGTSRSTKVSCCAAGGSTTTWCTRTANMQLLSEKRILVKYGHVNKGVEVFPYDIGYSSGNLSRLWYCYAFFPAHSGRDLQTQYWSGEITVFEKK